MKWITAYFSPTGATKKVAEAIAEGTGCPVEEIDLTDVKTTGIQVEPEASDVFLAAVPVYGGRVPSAAIERIKAIKGNDRNAAAVVVYGNREYEDALSELKDALKESGFHVTAAGAFIGEHSIIRSIAAGRPDEEDIKKARRFGTDIMKKINSAGADSPIAVPGKAPYKEVKNSPVHPSAGESCIRCGLCAAACPAAAIPKERPDLTEADKCINCMRCIQICPQGARSMPEMYLEKVRTMLEKTAASRKEPEVFL